MNQRPASVATTGPDASSADSISYIHRVAQEVRPVWAVRTPLEGEIACETLREHGIKCDCVEMPSQSMRTSPFRYSSAAGDSGMALTVIVAPEDAERAHRVLEEYTDLP